MIDSYELFANQAASITEQLPKFTMGKDGSGRNYVKGVLEIVDVQGNYWESYEVEIHWKDGFPFSFPYVFETGGKIPRISDWHIYEDTKSCCIAVPPEEFIICKNGISLAQFIVNEVTPYFFNQTFRKVEGYYKNGEHNHGLLGVFEYFSSLLNTKTDARLTISLMIRIPFVERPGRTHRCFCGRDEKFRKCHRDAYDKLTLLGKDQLISYALLFSEKLGYTDLVTSIKALMN